MVMVADFIADAGGDILFAVNQLLLPVLRKAFGAAVSA